jgi:hypothetical protein
VLMKYEAASGFEVKDDGSGLARSTARLGTELCSTATGDFAEGVPFEEWLHWKQYSVDPPDPQAAEALEKSKAFPAP